MRAPHRPAGRALGLLLVAGLALAATACNPGRPPAVEVGGTDISTTHVDAILAAYAEASPDDRSSIEGAGADTYDIAWARDVLRVLVVRTILSDLAAERGLTPSESEVTQARQEVEDTFSPPSDPELGARLMEAVDAGTRDWLIDLAADELVLRRALAEETSSDEEAQRFYDENPNQFATGCLRVIVVDGADLEAVQERLDGGEDFEAVSSEVTTIPELAELGGLLGQCGPLLGFQQNLGPDALAEILAAGEGEVTGPFELGDGSVVLAQATDRAQIPFDQVRQQIIDNVPSTGEQAVSDLVQERLDAVEIRVDPRFGRWDREARAVVPATVPGASTTTAAEPEPVEVDPAADAPHG